MGMSIEQERAAHDRLFSECERLKVEVNGIVLQRDAALETKDRWKKRAEAAELQLGAARTALGKIQDEALVPQSAQKDYMKCPDIAIAAIQELIKLGYIDSHIRVDTLGRPIDRAGQVKCETCDVLINYEYPNGEPRRKCSSCT